MHKMIKLTNKHKKHGYYILPGVNRPINPRDPLGLWNIYYAERQISFNIRPGGSS